MFVPRVAELEVVSLNRKKSLSLSLTDVIEPNTGGIERTRVGPTSDELGNAVTARPVRWGSVGKRIQRLDAGAQAHSARKSGIRHIVDRSCLRRSQAQPLIRDKEERLVLSVIQAWEPRPARRMCRRNRSAEERVR